MKAVNNNGIITFYQSVPSTFKSSTGLHMNVQNWSDQQMKDNGLFDVIIDDGYDSRIHDLGEIYWDTASTVFRKDYTNKTYTKTLEEYKDQAISNFKHRIGGELGKTDWYIIRQTDNGETVPTEVIEERQLLRNQTSQVENEINALTTIEEIITYEYPNID